MEKPTHDQIRSAALNHLSECKSGIRQSEFWEELLTLMSFEFEMDKNLIKNALWDLDTRYPEYVKKEKKAPRVVVIYPTDKLIKEASGAFAASTNYEEDFFDQTDMDYAYAKASVSELYRAVGTLEKVATETEHFPMRLMNVDISLSDIFAEDVEIYALTKKLYADLKNLSRKCKERQDKLERM